MLASYFAKASNYW